MKLFNLKIKTLFIAFCVCLCASFILFGVSQNKQTASAEQTSVATINGLLVAPANINEVFDFGSYAPSDAIAFDGGYAIIRTDKTLWISVGGKPFEQFTQVENPTQIKLLDQNTLVLLANNSLNLINLSDLSVSKLLYPNSSSTINGDTFDLKGNYLVVRSGAAVYLFEMEGAIVKAKVENQLIDELTADNLSPICVNDDGTVFYVKNNALHALKENKDVLLDYQSEGEIKNMICHNGQLFFIEYLQNKQVVKKTTFSETPECLEFTYLQTSDQLGKITTPNSLYFCGDNLLISDSGVGAVQEFEISSNTLVWTGFAIAKNKTAFNRITDTAKDIERYGENLAILSEDRISIAKIDQNFNAYDKDSFINLFAENFGGNLPSQFTLGKNSVLGIKNSTTVTFLSLDANAQAQDKQLNCDFIYDICYQSGYYYALTSLENQLVIYRISDNDLSTTQYGEKLAPKTNPVFTVDVFGNAYVFDQAEQIIKLASDLNGNIFAIKKDGFYRIQDNQPVKIANANGELESFTLCFDKEEVYFLYENSEFIYSTTYLPNTAINGTYVTSNYVLTDQDSDAKGLSFYKAKAGANVYSVTVDQNDLFQFNNLIEPENCYILICEIPQINHLALVGQNGVVLIEKSTAEVFDVPFTTQNKTAFISTDVNAYYFPIITQGDLYVLSNNGLKTKLEKGTEINVKKSFAFAGRDFYYATFSVEGETFVGYLPVDFTVDVLSEDFVYTSWTIRTVNQTNVYSNPDKSQLLTTLSEGTSIRLYSTENGISKIAFKDGEEWKIGYIDTKAIQDKPNTTIRNVLIVLAVTACLCGSITFFVLRKKQF